MSRPAKGPSSLAEHLALVPREDRDRMAGLILSAPVRSFDDLVDLEQRIMAEVVRGTLSVDTATVIGAYLELMFTTVAAKGREAGNARAATLLGQVIEAARGNAEQRAIAPTYATILPQHEVIDAPEQLTIVVSK